MDIFKIYGYENIEILYENQMVIICKALNKQGKIELIKLLKEDYITEEHKHQMEEEYSVLKQIEQKGFITPNELIKNYKGSIMVMNDVKGINIFESPIFKDIKNGNKDFTLNNLTFILNSFIKMVEIIEVIHEKKLIHKEINPEIFFFTEDFENIKILTLGIVSKINDFQNKVLTKETTDKLLSYISPEQTGRIRKNIDFRTDFYSLGISMYELIMGEKPFVTDNVFEIIHSHIAKIPTSPDLINKNIPKMLSKIIMKLIEKEPEQRYQSTKGIIDDLKKCLAMLNNLGKIEEFEIGKTDISNNFYMRKKIYGRNREREIFKTIYEQALQGEKQFLLIGGNPGIGKTSLVQEIYRPIAEIEGYFAEGKAEKLQINIPYYVFIQASKGLIHRILQESDKVLNEWKADLLTSLNKNIQIIIDIIPEVGTIIGEQPEVQVLAPLENRNRFFNTFANFFKVFIRKERPLTIFLDDLQWCDQSSLEFLDYLMRLEEIKELLIVGCYRDNEISEEDLINNLFVNSIEDIKITKFSINPLDEKNIQNIIKDIVHGDEDKIEILAKTLYRKTNGNPFFLRNVLFYLYNNNFIVFNKTISSWEWDNNKIQNISISENIADFMIGKILELSSKTQNLLKIAALVGTRFNIWTLCIVENMEVIEIIDTLKEAINNELIIKESDFYDTNSFSKFKRANTIFRFTHDRVQQAFVDLTSEEDKKKLHLKIGRSIKENVPKNILKNHVMSIVCHLNEAFDEIDEPSKKFEAAQLNLWACEQAKKASAFKPAMKYISNAVKILPDNSWDYNYQLTFEIMKMYSECAYLNNKYDLAEENITILIKHVKTNLEEAEIRLMQSILYRFSGQFDKTIEYGIIGLKLLGVRISDKIGFHLALKEFLAAKTLLKRKTTKDLLHAQPINNDKIELIIRIFCEITSVAYLVNVNLFLLSTLKNLNLTLKYGNSPQAASIYSGYAVLLAVVGDFKGSYEFQQLALKLVEEKESIQYRASILFAYGFMGHSWSVSFQDLEQWFKESMEEAIRYGDHYQVALAGTFMYAFKSNMNLGDLIDKAMEQVPIIKRTNNKFGYYASFLIINRYLNYAGLTDEKFTLNVSQETYRHNENIGILCTEEECIKNLREIDSQSGLGMYYKEKMYIHYLYDDYEGAMIYLKESDKYLKNHNGTPYIVECRLCNFLIIGANLSKMNKNESLKNKLRLKKEYKHVKAWAKYNESNFKHLQYLLEAEFARIEGKIYEALKLYELSIKFAQKNGFIRDEALANELVAKMFLENGMNKQASFYMTESLNTYLAWGATRKVEHIKNNYKELVLTNSIPNYNSSLKKSLISYAASTIDFNAVVNASQALSEEVQIDSILQKLIYILLENSGAQNIYYLIQKEDNYLIQAQGHSESSDIIVLENNVVNSDKMPLNIINYVCRLRESVILDDASTSDIFGSDKYVISNECKSLMCLPVVHKGNLKGILYLENNLVTGVFNEERSNALKTIATQLAISLENSYLINNLQHLVEDKTSKLREEIEERRNAELFLNTLIETVPIPIFSKDISGKYTRINRSFEEVFGKKRTELLGKSVFDTHPKDLAQIYHEKDLEIINHYGIQEYENKISNAKGELKDVIFHKSSITDKSEKIIGLVGAVLDITDMKKVKENLDKMAHYDSLTNLPNRRLFQTYLEHSIELANRNKSMLAVLFIDLDGFKKINDKYGHDKGDVVLVTTAERLITAVRSCDTVSRMGGDEFVIILENIKNNEEIEMVCNRIIQAVEMPIEFTDLGIEAFVTSSIGIGILNNDGTTSEELLINADKAMYVAKNNGKNQFVFNSKE